MVSRPCCSSPRAYILIARAVEFATVGQTKDGKVYHRLWNAEEITALLKEHDLAKDESTEDE
jgi:20S proteasome subunit alpha 3